jgi:rRNA-processing protein FCF1
MIVIDTNALLILIIGQIDANLIESHKRTSIYEPQDYYDLLRIIGNFENLLILPNIWTEVDNLLNNFTGEQKYHYVLKFTEIVKLSTEKYVATINSAEAASFYDLGLTDSLLLILAKENKLLMTSDSTLSDYAIASGINVYDIVKNRNVRF